MKAIVVGCGRIGAELAYRLQKRGHDVSIIDNVPASLTTYRLISKAAFLKVVH